MRTLGVDFRDPSLYLDKDYIICDPPWLYGDRHPKLDRSLSFSLWHDNVEGVRWVLENTSPKALFLWTTSSMLEACFEAYRIASTSLVYKVVVTWVKTTNSGGLFFGLGSHFRASTEHLMVFVKEGTPTLRTNMRTIILEDVLPTAFAEKAEPKCKKPKSFERQLIQKLGGSWGYIFSGPDASWCTNLNVDLIDQVFALKPINSKIGRLNLPTKITGCFGGVRTEPKIRRLDLPRDYSRQSENLEEIRKEFKDSGDAISNILDDLNIK